MLPVGARVPRTLLLQQRERKTCAHSPLWTRSMFGRELRSKLSAYPLTAPPFFLGKRVLTTGRRISTALATSEPPVQLPSHIPIEEELQDGYSPKDFYPVRLGDVYNGVYQVACKFGFGSCSTVWLARDIRRQDPWYIVLKICANNYEDKASAEHELEISHHIATANPSHPGHQFVRHVWDNFELQGPDGTHICLVYEPLREPLWLYQQRFPRAVFPSDEVKVILKCTLFGLDYLHTECHVIHADLKPENVLTGYDNQFVLEETAREEAEEPSPRKVIGDRTIYLSRIVRYPGDRITKITDVDMATRGDVSYPLTAPIQPNHYRAPEVTLGAPWTYSADIWNLGIMIWDLLEGAPLCDGFDPCHNEHTCPAQLGQIIGLLGPPPKKLLERGTDSHGYFNPNGEFRDPNLIRTNPSLADSVTSLEGEDKRLFLEFANKMLQWLPENRKTAKELLGDPWLSRRLEDQVG